MLKFDTAFQAVRVVVGGSAASMNKTVQPGFARWKTGQSPLWAGEMPPLVAGATTFPPAKLGALWVLSSVLHDTTEKRREAYSPP